MQPQIEPYDAVLLVSFGGPEGPDDVMPFLENVTGGRGIPRERLLEVAEHYNAVGGVSPINAQNRALLAEINADFAVHDITLPVFWGNRNWAPYLSDALTSMNAAGVQRAAVFVTSAYSSYSGCRQYREDLAVAVEQAGGAPHLDKLRHYFNHPGFVEPLVDATVDAVAELPTHAREGAHLVFVTHSIPTDMAEASGPAGNAYQAQHLELSRLIATQVTIRTGTRLPWELVYCSRSGDPSRPWLEPDINDHLRALSVAGASGVVVVPIGFVSDHMEVGFDLDTEAAESAGSLGLPFSRARTAGIDPRFVAMVRELVVERAAVERGEAVHRSVCGALGASHDVCPVACCPNLRGPKPALTGADDPAQSEAMASDPVRGAIEENR